MLTDRALSDFRFWLYNSQKMRYNDFDDLKEILKNELILSFISQTDMYYTNVVLVSNLQAFEYQEAKRLTIDLFNYNYNKEE